MSEFRVGDRVRLTEWAWRTNFATRDRNGLATASVKQFRPPRCCSSAELVARLRSG